MTKVIGIDIGGTKIKAGLIDEKGKIIEKIRLETESVKGRDIILSKVFNIIDIFKESHTISAIGIGSPGFINSNKGIVEYVVNTMIDWQGTNIKKEIEDRISIPTVVDKDSNLAAIGEMWMGAAKNLDSFIMITLGTGVGGSYYNSKFGTIKGHHWRAGEIGHTILYPDGAQCACGQKGCVEQYISGTAIERMYEERYGRELKGSEIFKRGYEGDPNSKAILDEFLKNGSIFLTSLTNFADPEAIIISGGLINSKEYWLEGLIRQFKERLNGDMYPEIIPAELSNDAGMIGAAKIAFDYLEK